jgi:cytochrome c biogenesis protein CcmG, thiol:disulfide interchange protein DsbE
MRSPANPSRNLWLWLPFLGFVGLVVLFFVRLQAGDPSLVPSTLMGRLAPPLSLPPLSASAIPSITLQDLKGKVVLVNVFASWCVPCREEHPLLVSLAREEGIRVLGISYKDDPKNARDFLDALGNPYAAIGMDREGRASIEWGVYGVPETFVLDPQGRVLRRIIGALNAQHRLEILALSLPQKP